MIYLINDKRQPENHFWNCLHGLASELQLQRVLDGMALIIGTTKYQIIFEEKDLFQLRFLAILVYNSMEKLKSILLDGGSTNGSME